MFRISREGIDHQSVVSFDEILPALRSNGPGFYVIDVCVGDPFPGGHTYRRWGVGIKKANGEIELESFAQQRLSPLSFDRPPDEHRGIH
jgi:hypothetical protein